MANAVAQRYREAGDEEKTPWRLGPEGWQTFNGVLIPTPAAVTWVDEGTPWAVFTLEEVIYNVRMPPPCEARMRRGILIWYESGNLPFLC